MANTHAVVRYRIRNWRAYNRALINRGRLTVWFDEQAILVPCLINTLADHAASNS